MHRAGTAGRKTKRWLRTNGCLLDETGCGRRRAKGRAQWVKGTLLSP